LKLHQFNISLFLNPFRHDVFSRVCICSTVKYALSLNHASVLGSTNLTVGPSKVTATKLNEKDKESEGIEKLISRLFYPMHTL
jgi:hypothetical protein